MLSTKTCTLFLALLVVSAQGVDVPAFTSFQQGGSLDGKLVRIRPTSGTPSVEGATPTVTDGVLSIEPPFADIIDIFAPRSTFAQVSLSGEGGVVKVSDHDPEPMTCLGSTFDAPAFTATVSASTNLSLGCIDTATLTIRQTGQTSFISTWWTLTAGEVDVINSGEGASTFILGDITTVKVALPGEKATISVRDAGAVITGTSVGGRVYYATGGTGSCTVSLPGPQGSACFPLPDTEVSTIRALSFNSWPKP